MKLIVSIDKENYKRIKDDVYDTHDIHRAIISIRRGTPLDVLDKISAEIEQKIEQERFARSVFRGEEKDAVKAEQCTGSIMAYNNVIKFIDKYKAESEDKE